jgi:hypothetical protein
MMLLSVETRISEEQIALKWNKDCCYTTTTTTTNNNNNNNNKKKKKKEVKL